MRRRDEGLPSGEVTFVFTDIEGSTRLLRELGEDGYDDLLQRHHAILRRSWTRHGGFEVNTEGDSFFVAFSSALGALDACGDAQAALTTEHWPADAAVRVRMGIHSGLARPRNRDYASLAVHQAARVMHSASGGQVLVTEHVVQGIKDLDGERLRALGKFRVRDFDEPVALFELCDPRWAAAGAAPRVLPASGHNMARPSTRLLGRGRELDALRGLIAAGALVSIVGPGGIGKTRLAMELGSSTADRWPDGVWFVSLESLSSDVQLAGAVATTAALGPLGGMDPVADLATVLTPRRMLLVLDNCEHLLEGCAAMAGVLQARCDGVGLLTTSRAPLGLRSEMVWRLGPLSTEPDDGGAAPAVELFRERAEWGTNATAGARQDQSSLVELCRRLDGIPLAIELAAAHAHRVSVRDLLTALHRREGLPPLRDPTLPARQRSLEELLAWSYGLLSQGEQRALRRLSLFASGFDLASAEVAIAFDGISAGEVGRLVWSLVDQSLVVAEPVVSRTRYRLLATVRDYAEAHHEAGERMAVVNRLVGYYLGHLGPTVDQDRAWAGEVELELDNIRAVIAAGTPDDAARRQALSWTVGRHLDLTDLFSPGIAEMRRLITELDAPTPEFVALLSLLADLELRVGDLAGATETAGRAAALRDEVGSAPWDDAGVARTEGDIALRKGEFSRALELADTALALHPSGRGSARLWNLVGLVHAASDDPVRARHAFERELDAWVELGIEAPQATTHGNLAEILLRLGDLNGAARHQLACLDLALALGQPVLCAFSLVVAARLLCGGGRWHEGLRMQGAADRALAEHGYVLYDSDVAERTSMLNAALDSLGEEERDRALEIGSTVGLGSATSEAADVLRELVEGGTRHARRRTDLTL